MIALRNFGWLPLAGVTAAAALGTTYVQHVAPPPIRHAHHHPHHHAGHARADQPSPGCRHLPDTVAQLSTDLEVGELIAWAGAFTCQGIVYDPRIVNAGKRITVLAPQPMTAEQGVELFHAALATLGLAAVPDGNVIRIVEAAAIVPAAPAPQICVATTIADAAGTTLSAPVMLAVDGDKAKMQVVDPDRTLALAVTPHAHDGHIALDVSYDERSRGAGGTWTTHTLSTHAIAVDRQPVTLGLPDRHIVITPSQMGVGGNPCSR
jgi:hypothetical protein